jgi:hypothetical protein
VKYSLIVIISCLCVAFTTPAQAQKRGNKKPRVSPNASVSQTIGTTKITITYGRPGVKGRKIYGGLVPYGKVWRTGANESTDIVLPKDVTVEGKSLPAGTYSIYTIPGKKQWTIIFNSKLSWGTQYDKSKDVLRVQAKPETTRIPMEQLLFYFKNVTNESAEVVVYWDKTKVSFMIEL